MVVFDTNRLLELAKDFSFLTGATVSIWDSNFNQLLSYPERFFPLCEIVKNDSTGRNLCLCSDKKSCILSQKMDKPYKFRCHVGLLDTVFPLWYENTVVAYIMIGQMRDEEENFVTLDALKKLTKKYGISDEDAEKYFYQLPVIKLDQIDAAANVLRCSTLYLLMSQIIKIEKNDQATELDEYITRNISSDLSVKKICADMLLPKNMLYQISNKYFNMPIKKYIALKRVEEAKKFLTASALPVNEICELVGISDYNYFIRFFKSNVGYSPLKYRRLFSTPTK